MEGRPLMGTWVVFTATLQARRIERRREWVRVEHPHEVGLYAGYRTVFDGDIRHNGYDEPTEFVQTKAHRHALVFVNDRRAPLRVPFDAMGVAATTTALVHDGGE